MFKTDVWKIFVFMLMALFWAGPSFGEYAGDGQARDQIISQELDTWESDGGGGRSQRRSDVAAPNPPGVFDPYYGSGYSDWVVEKDDDEQIDSEYELPEWVPSKDNRQQDSMHTFDAQFSVAKYKYNEDHCYNCEVIEEGNNRLKHRGNLFGIHGEYTYRPDKRAPLYSKHLNVFRADASFKWAGDLTEIHSATDTVVMSEVSDVANKIFEFRGIVGKEYPKGIFDVLLYSGLGYRHRWDKDKPELTPDNYPTFRSSSYNFYLPVGVELYTQHDSDWDYKVKGEYDLFLMGKTTHFYSDFNPYYPGQPTQDATFDQKGGFGLKGGLEIIKKAPGVDFVFGPYFEYWKMNATDNVGLLWLGENKETDLGEPYTIESGIKIGVKY